ncbi:MAG: tripartite tricarboxylate transporter substrate binding protein [Thermodesulfobacteriota bacterium]
MRKGITRNAVVLAVAAVVGLGFLASDSLAQAKFPTRPVNLWVGFPPGGAADVLARTLAEASEKALGQKIVVINKAGGGGTVATSILKNEKPDGYTLLLSTDTPIDRAPHISDLEYDPFKDVDHFMLIGKWRTVWTVKADSPFQKWSDMADWARKNKDQLTFGHCPASSFYFGMVKMAKKEGFTFKGVPYPCDGPTMTAVLGGHVMVGGGTAAPYRSHVLANNIRILLSDGPISYLEGRPQTTFNEMKYDFEVPLLAIVLAPKGIPEDVRKTLEKAFGEGMKTDLFKKVAQNQELAPKPMTGRAFTDYLKKASDIYEELSKESGLYKSQKK